MLKDFIRGWDDYIYHGFVPKTISFDFVPKKEIYPIDCHLKMVKKSSRAIPQLKLPSNSIPGVFINGGTQKWMVYTGKSYYLGVPPFSKTSIHPTWIFRSKWCPKAS
jgi:hypothetical protein